MFNTMSCFKFNVFYLYLIQLFFCVPLEGARIPLLVTSLNICHAPNLTVYVIAETCSK